MHIRFIYFEPKEKIHFIVTNVKILVIKSPNICLIYEYSKDDEFKFGKDLITILCDKLGTFHISETFAYFNTHKLEEVPQFQKKAFEILIDAINKK